MWGPHYRRSDKPCITEASRVEAPRSFDILPSYNAAPWNFQPLVRLNADVGEHDFVQIRWGLVPFWSKGAKIAYNTINAKCETLLLRRAVEQIPAGGEGIHE